MAIDMGRMRFHLATILLLLPLMASAQNAAPPDFPVETVHSDADREIETVTSRPGWHGAGSAPLDYQFGTGLEPDGDTILLIRAKAAASSKYFGTLMQSHPPGRYLGKRIKLTARMKSDDVSWLAMWLRVDGEKGEGEPLSFYNMHNHPVRGTRDWQTYEIVLDVPKQARLIAYGFFIAGGRGTAYADKVTLQPVGNDVAVTGTSLGFDTRF